ncbi:MAG: protein phosphatase 2C domain-containing protein, partial [Ruminococcus sp.]|nr:protein phosphatase 2C domain-containing protein [Ruminococcus sp.]
MIINSAKYSCAAGHDINEDSCLCSAERGIFIVADGLGGHSSGEKASLAAVDYFEENCFGGYTNESIAELLEGANTEVSEKGDGGKTTVAAAFTENGNFIFANVGDSRVYYFRNGRIIAQTKDHSVCQASVDVGMIRQEDIRGNEDRSRLLKVLGGNERLNIKKYYPPIKIQNGDAFLVCSDGFWEYVYETEMEADLLKSDNSEVWLKYMLKRHILRAENKGDNYTAVCGIIYLDGSEVYVPPVSNETQTEQSARRNTPVIGNRLLIPAAAACVLLITAAIALAVSLQKKEEPAAEITETASAETEEISESISETETEAETGDTESDGEPIPDIGTEAETDDTESADETVTDNDTEAETGDTESADETVTDNDTEAET